MSDTKSEFLASSRESSLPALAEGADDWADEELPFDIQFAADERSAAEISEAEGFAGNPALAS